MYHLHPLARDHCRRVRRRAAPRQTAPAADPVRVVKDLDDHEDGLNEAAFERALSGVKERKARTRKSAPVTKLPTLADLERAHRAAFARENKLVAALPENAPAAQIAAAWRAAEVTNAALRAVQAHPDYPHKEIP